MKRLLTLLALFALLNTSICAQDETTIANSDLTSEYCAIIEVGTSELESIDFSVIENLVSEISSQPENTGQSIQIDESTPQIQMTEFNYKDTKEWKKYKTLRAIGWSFLGTGPVCFLGGTCVALRAGLSNDSHFVGVGAIAMLSGIAMTVSSIPILICAYYNRNKAMKMNANLGISTINTKTFFNKDFSSPAITLSLCF